MFVRWHFLPLPHSQYMCRRRTITTYCILLLLLGLARSNLTTTSCRATRTHSHRPQERVTQQITLSYNTLLRRWTSPLKQLPQAPQAVLALAATEGARSTRGRRRACEINNDSGILITRLRKLDTHIIGRAASKSFMNDATTTTAAPTAAAVAAAGTPTPAPGLAPLRY